MRISGSSLGNPRRLPSPSRMTSSFFLPSERRRFGPRALPICGAGMHVSRNHMGSATATLGCMMRSARSCFSRHRTTASPRRVARCIFAETVVDGPRAGVHHLRHEQRQGGCVHHWKRPQLSQHRGRESTLPPPGQDVGSFRFARALPIRPGRATASGDHHRPRDFTSGDRSLSWRSATRSDEAQLRRAGRLAHTGVHISGGRLPDDGNLHRPT